MCLSVTFLITHIYLVGAVLGEDQKNKHHDYTCLKDINLHHTNA